MAEIVCCALPNVAKCRRPHWRNVAVVYHRQNWLEWLGNGTIGCVGVLWGFPSL